MEMKKNNNNGSGGNSKQIQNAKMSMNNGIHIAIERDFTRELIPGDGYMIERQTGRRIRTRIMRVRKHRRIQ